MRESWLQVKDSVPDVRMVCAWTHMEAASSSAVLDRFMFFLFPPLRCASCGVGSSKGYSQVAFSYRSGMCCIWRGKGKPRG